MFRNLTQLAPARGQPEPAPALHGSSQALHGATIVISCLSMCGLVRAQGENRGGSKNAMSDKSLMKCLKFM